jgi:hypothetical protein
MSNFKVLTIQNFDEVTRLEESKIKNLDEIARMNLVWKAPWRKESLEHYLQTGWCIGKYNLDHELEAYFLAQPILFMESLTQTLWVEYLSYSNLDIGLSLIDFAYKYGRDKHLQRVLFNKDTIFDKVNVPFKVVATNKDYVEVYTTKIT